MSFADQNLTDIESFCWESPGLLVCHLRHLPGIALLIGSHAGSYFSNNSVAHLDLKWNVEKLFSTTQSFQGCSYLGDWTERVAAFKNNCVDIKVDNSGSSDSENNSQKDNDWGVWFLPKEILSLRPYGIEKRVYGGKCHSDITHVVAGLTP